MRPLVMPVMSDSGRRLDAPNWCRHGPLHVQTTMEPHHPITLCFEVSTFTRSYPFPSRLVVGSLSSPLGTRLSTPEWGHVQAFSSATLRTGSGWHAARVHGRGDVRTVLRVLLPMTRPDVAAAALFCFMYIWNDYFGPLLFVPGITRVDPAAERRLPAAFTGGGPRDREARRGGRPAAAPPAHPPRTCR